MFHNFSVFFLHTNNKIQRDCARARSLVRVAVVIVVEAVEVDVGREMLVRERIFDERHMTEHVLIRHLNGVSSLGANLLDGAANVRRADVFESRYANVERDECS